MLSSLANLQKTLDELLDVMSITASANCDLLGSNDSNTKDQITNASEKRRRFFDRSELKKVNCFSNWEQNFWSKKIITVLKQYLLYKFQNNVGDGIRRRFSGISKKWYFTVMWGAGDAMEVVSR